MTEEFLQYIWKFALYDSTALITDEGEEITVLKCGEVNYNAGPDFLNAKLKIGETIWAGNVELHILSSDWNRHNHHKDKAYNNVILHVVLKNDNPVAFQNGNTVPTAEIKFDKNLYEKYRQLIRSDSRIPCQDYLKVSGDFRIQHFINRLVVERLIEKSALISQTLQLNKNDWSETLYIHLARNFGFRVNSIPFEMLARSLPLRYISRHKDNLLQLEALIFGQAGFLNEDIKDDYQAMLSGEYYFLKRKFRLKSLEKHNWKFMRLRPDNFPTIRLAQFAMFLFKSPSLFAGILSGNKPDQIRKAFDISASGYWDNHYTFGELSCKNKTKKLGVDSYHNIFINTIVPVLFTYGNFSDISDLKEKALDLLAGIPAEDNNIIREWKNLGFGPKNAYETQGLIQLKNSYCRRRKCINCSIGSKIIVRTN